MNSAMNKNRLAEKRYRHNSKKDKKEIRLNTKNMKNKKIRKTEEGYKKHDRRLQKPRKTTK